MSAAASKSGVRPDLLKCFWDLTEADQETRWKALQKLVLLATTAQQNSSLPKDPSQLCPSMNYTLNRLLRGLASSTQHMRGSSSIGLALLLRQMPFVKASDFFALIDRHLFIKEDMPEASRKDVCIGRALAYTVALKMEYDQESMDAHCQMIDGLLELYAETELRELCAVNLAEMLSQQSTFPISHVLKNGTGLVKLFEKSTLDATAEDIFLCVRLWHLLPNHILDTCSVLPQTKEDPVAHEPEEMRAFHLEAAAVFFAEGHFTQLAPALQDSIRNHPCVHCVWEPILSLLLCGVDKHGTHTPHSKIQIFWKGILHPLSGSTAQKQFLAQTLSLKILPHLSPAYLPSILGGAYWENITSIYPSEANALQESAIECFQKIMAIAKRTTEYPSGWLRVMVLCRLPHTADCDGLREALMQQITSDDVKQYATRLMDQFSSTAVSPSDCCIRFENKEILRDFRNVAKLQRLDSATIFEIIQLLACTGLFCFDEEGGIKTDRDIQRRLTIPTDRTDALQQQCMCCLMHLYASFDASVLSTSEEETSVSLLAKALSVLSLDGVRLAREVSEAEKDTLRRLEDLTDFLETLLSDTEEEFKRKRIRVLHDLLSTIKLYYYGNAETVSPVVIEDFSRLVALLFGSVTEATEPEEESDLSNDDSMSVPSDLEFELLDDADDGEEHYMDVLTSILIDLCVRRTDPYSIRLMMKYAKCTFAVFCSDLTFSSWIGLFNALSNADAFDVEQEEAVPPSEDDSRQIDGSSETETEEMEEDEMALENASLDDLTDAFDASALLVGDKGKLGSDEGKRMDEDLNCASLRILAFIEHVVKKHSRKAITLLVPLLLVKTMSHCKPTKGSRTQQQNLQQKLENVFQISLTCKPELHEEDMEIVQSTFMRVIKEIPIKTEHRDKVSRAVSFCITRLISNVHHEAACKRVASVMMQEAISQQFRRRSSLIHTTAIASLLSQQKELRQGSTVKHIVACAAKTKSLPQKLKALEFINICIKDEENIAMALKDSHFDELLLALLETRVNGRRKAELFQLLIRACRNLHRLPKHQLKEILPIDELQDSVQKKLNLENTPKDKQMWTQLMKTLHRA